jgi:hypothetical protein
MNKLFIYNKDMPHLLRANVLCHHAIHSSRSPSLRTFADKILKAYKLIKNQIVNEDKDICAEEIESWSSYEYSLRKEDAEYFHNMLEECKKYSDAINAKGGLLPTEPMVMALMLIQHKMIKKLLGIVESERLDINENYLKKCDDREK